MIKRAKLTTKTKLEFHHSTIFVMHELNLSLRFVSDHGPVGCQALLQHRLIQANQKAQVSSGSAPEASRTYPLSLLEWTANRKKASMVLQVHCFDGEFRHLPPRENNLLVRRMKTVLQKIPHDGQQAQAGFF